MRPDDLRTSLLNRMHTVEFTGGDPELLFGAQAEHCIDDLLVQAVQQGLGAEGTTRDHASALFVVGALLLCRTQNPIEAYGWDRWGRDQALGRAMLMAAYETDIEAAPPAVRSLFPPPPDLRTPRWERWITDAGDLVRQTSREDNGAGLSAAVILQLGLSISRSAELEGPLLAGLGHALIRLYPAVPLTGLADEVVRLVRRAMDHARRGTTMSSDTIIQIMETLGIAYQRGIRSDAGLLVEGIDLGRRLLASLSPDHPDSQDAACDLGNLFALLYEETSDPGCLGHALELNRSVLDRMPPEDPAYAGTVYNVLSTVAKSDDAVPDAELDDAVDLGLSTLRRLPLKGLPRADISAIVSHLLRRRHLRGRPGNDLDQAIALARDAVASVPPSDRVPLDSYRAFYRALEAKHRSGKAPGALDEAIDVARHAVRATSSGHFDLGAMLNNRYADAADDARDEADLRAAVAAFQAAASDPATDLRTQVTSAWYAGRNLAVLGDWAAAASALETAIGLLPRLAGRRRPYTEKPGRLLGELSPMVSIAASCAIAAGSPHMALQHVENGRGVLFAETTVLRNGADDLYTKAPELADDLSTLSGQLETATDAESRSVLNATWDRTIAQIRRVPGFEGFLASQTAADLMAQAPKDPVVILIHSIHRSDALIVTTDHLRHVPLTDLTMDSFRRHSSNLFESQEAAQSSSAAERRQAERQLGLELAWIWETITEPVLEAVGFTSTTEKSADTLPRLWWCPTGLLSFLPLHAAGRRPDGPGVADHCISSYTPSLRALRGMPRWKGITDEDLLVVALPRTPGYGDLPMAGHEASQLMAQFPGCALLMGPAATRQRVTGRLTHHSCVHFACHGDYLPQSSDAGGLRLHDGTLTMADVAAVPGPRSHSSRPARQGVTPW
ncbi:CHAT domain-containing protein [Streptomyces chiangmaiensis]